VIVNFGLASKGRGQSGEQTCRGNSNSLTTHF
jgi:hypothetical protein